MTVSPNNQPLIVLSGGGTLGSVTPLLAVADDLRGAYRFLFVGTKQGVERSYVKEAAVPFVAVSGGKLRRYWSWRNCWTPWLFVIGWAQSWRLFKKIRPALLITAGSFVSVAPALAAWCLKIPVLVHQLDYEPGLANKLMARLAKRVTVTFQKSTADYGAKAVWTGSPTRRRLLLSADRAKADKFFKLNADRPVVLVLGGGTGAAGLNHLIVDNLYNLTQLCQIIHLTGAGKELSLADSSAYRQFASLDQAQMALAYQAAQVVISRAGLGTLAELAVLAKPAIIIPMPDSHQEANAAVLAEQGAAVVLEQKKTTARILYRELKTLLADNSKQQALGQNLSRALKTDANEAIIKIIQDLINN